MSFASRSGCKTPVSYSTPYPTKAGMGLLDWTELRLDLERPSIMSIAADGGVPTIADVDYP